MSYTDGNYIPTEWNSMDFPACQSCNHTLCVCRTTDNDFTPQRNYEHAYTTPSHLMSLPSYYPPLPLVEDRSTISAPQDEWASSHYNQSEQLCYHHGGRVMTNAVMSTWASGGYDYGRNSEAEARSQEQLATLLNPLIVSMSEGDVPNEPVFLPEDNLLIDGTVDPRELSLPVVKMPCPQCGRLLKDEKSVSRHVARTHSPNAIYYYCEEYGCSYRSTKKNDVPRHVLTHTGSKPFTCWICGAGHNRKDNLKRHLATCSRNISRQ